MIDRASARVEKSFSLRHSSRNLPLKLSTKAFCVGLPGANMMQPKAAIDRPAQHGQAGELGAVVQNDGFGVAADRGDRIEYANDALSAQ